MNIAIVLLNWHISIPCLCAAEMRSITRWGVHGATLYRSKPHMRRSPARTVRR